MKFIILLSLIVASTQVMNSVHLFLIHFLQKKFVFTNCIFCVCLKLPLQDQLKPEQKTQQSRNQLFPAQTDRPALLSEARTIDEITASSDDIHHDNAQTINLDNIENVYVLEIPLEKLNRSKRNDSATKQTMLAIRDAVGIFTAGNGAVTLIAPNPITGGLTVLGGIVTATFTAITGRID